MKENKKGGSCNTYGGDDKFLAFKPEGRNQSGDLGIDGKIITYKVSRKQRVCAGVD
jgi:hypothetical protein